MALDDKTLAESMGGDQPVVEYPIDMPVHDAVHLDTFYLDGINKGQGIMFEHFRALPCPVGKGDKDDIRRTHEDHEGCSNGHIYEKVGDILCIFTGNGKSIKIMDMGTVTDSTVQVTVPRFYADQPRKEAIVAVFDRVYLKENTARVIATQLFEHNISGMDRMKYPITEVEVIIDSHGKRYRQGIQFDVVNGQVKWRGLEQPGMDPTSGKGETCSIRYQYIPYWYVERLMHELRLVRKGDHSVRAPMSVLLQREYVFENEDNDPRSKTPNSPRQAVAPRDGQFGPR